MTVGNKDYYIDLLFYHRKLRRLVLIERLEVDKSGIHVGQYLTLLPPKELFQEKLHKAIEISKTSILSYQLICSIVKCSKREIKR
ncbi:DUF1016 family protein [Clostridium gasigenes]|nr:DUF1016 family protein [Clostridium gasigenes]